MTTRRSDHDVSEKKRLQAEIAESREWITRLSDLIALGRMNSETMTRTRKTIEYHETKIRNVRAILEAIQKPAQHDAARKRRSSGE